MPNVKTIAWIAGIALLTNMALQHYQARAAGSAKRGY